MKNLMITLSLSTAFLMQGSFVFAIKKYPVAMNDKQLRSFLINKKYNEKIKGFASYLYTVSQKRPFTPASKEGKSFHSFSKQVFEQDWSKINWQSDKAMHLSYLMNTSLGFESEYIRTFGTKAKAPLKIFQTLQSNIESIETVNVDLAAQLFLSMDCSDAGLSEFLSSALASGIVKWDLKKTVKGLKEAERLSHRYAHKNIECDRNQKFSIFNPKEALAEIFELNYSKNEHRELLAKLNRELARP